MKNIFTRITNGSILSVDNHEMDDKYLFKDDDQYLKLSP